MNNEEKERKSDKAAEIFWAGDREKLQAPFKQPKRWSLKFKIFLVVIILLLFYFWLWVFSKF